MKDAAGLAKRNEDQRMTDSLQGYLEEVANNTLVGWALDLNVPEACLRVQARVGAKSVLEVTADIIREDLLEAGLGTGRHGFRMVVEPDLFRLFLNGTAELWVADATATRCKQLRKIHELNKPDSFANRIQGAFARIRKGAPFSKLKPDSLTRSASDFGQRVEAGTVLANADLAVDPNHASLSSEPSFPEELQHEDRSISSPFEMSGQFFGWIDVQRASRLSGWMLATRNTTTPVLTIDGLPASRTEWPLPRKDVTIEYGVERRTGFQFSYDSAPGAKAELFAFDGFKLMSGGIVRLPTNEQPSVLAMIPQLMRDAAKHDAVAITCWDGSHNPIGRAKVLYDVLDGRRPVWLFTYLFDEFGGTLWEPLKDAGLRIIAVPWKEREHYHRLFEIYGIKFSTIWMCKPRFPTLLMASAISGPQTKLVLDFDDNEEHFSKSPGSTGKIYGGDTIGLVRSLIGSIRARTAASVSLAEDYKAEIVRHARKSASTLPDREVLHPSRPLRIGFVGTVRPHKNLLDAAQAIRVVSHIAGRKLHFCVYGDIRPEAYRKQLEANSVETHGTVPASDLEAALQTFDLVLTGFPSQAVGDEPITRYQITSKIGDALRSGIPALVPRSRSVQDLADTPGVFLFDASDFSDVLLKAVNYTKKITLPKEFTLDGAYDAFRKAESKAPDDSSSLDGLRPQRSSNCSERSVLLIWKQQDGGLYGRRVDQVARAIKRADPKVTVRVVEFINESVQADMQEKGQNFTSDAAQILMLAELKRSGKMTSPEGVYYNQISVRTDADSAQALIDFLWAYGHSPDNTLVVTFPAFSLLTHLAKVIDPFRIICDIVDNQLSWGNNSTRSDLIAQYVWLMRKSCRVVFNASTNVDYFKSAGFLQEVPNEKILTIPNWYIPPVNADALLSKNLESMHGGVNVIYSGNLNDRIDWDLLSRCANASPDMRLHIVGDAYRVADKLRLLAEIDNVIYHGPLNEVKVSNLLRKMHFAVMPHLQDTVSTYMNPLKPLMYAAHGLRTVAIKVPGLGNIDGLHVVESRDGFIGQVSSWVKASKEGALTSPAVSSKTPQAAVEYVNMLRSQMHYGQAEKHTNSVPIF